VKTFSYRKFFSIDKSLPHAVRLTCRLAPPLERLGPRIEPVTTGGEI
jgi:hypothetical protein